MPITDRPLTTGPERQLDALLEKTSRTFALSIPLLPEPVRSEVGIAYLLFRIADTFEDAVGWPRERRIRALAELAELLADPGGAEERARSWLAGPAAIPHEGYHDLLAAAPRVLAAYSALPFSARETMRVHLSKTLAGMARFVDRADEAGNLALADLEELREYCYVVAGIVGEMLTELFLQGLPSLALAGPALRGRARAFGEGLQLVNILKDSAVDLREGRRYLPAEVPTDAVFLLARRDLDAAGEYTRQLQGSGAPRGVVAFTALPVLLARQSLERVEQHGAGAKLTRGEVFATLATLEADLERGAPAVP
jgi:farnesyl-diphosphate farnesyltransferase